MVNKNDVWLITGCSKGLGRALAQEALKAGYRVVVTARCLTDVDDIVQTHKDRALAAELDVTSLNSIRAAVASAEERFGGVDVLVNNAGYGYFGAIEEGEDFGVRALFETNVFGPVNLLKAVLPGMRERGHGQVINISSVGGVVTYPAVGYYHMTKFAIEALSETLAKELSPFGVGVTVVEPGGFRTEFRGSNADKQPATRISAYADTAGKARDTVFANRRFISRSVQMHSIRFVRILPTSIATLMRGRTYLVVRISRSPASPDAPPPASIQTIAN